MVFNPTLHYALDVTQIKWTLNSELSFSKNACDNKAQEHSVKYHFCSHTFS